MSWIALAIVSVVIADLAVRVFYVRLILPQFETKPPFNVTRHPVDPHAEPVSVITRDGVLLRGAVHRTTDSSTRGVIVFFPELDGDHWSACHYGEGLLAAGFDLVSFDFRGQGLSDAPVGYSPNHWPTHFELWDASAVLQWVSEQPEWQAVPVGIFGISRGSIIGMMTTAEFPNVRAFCGEGTYSIDRLLEHFALRWAQLYLPPFALRHLPRWHLRLTLRMARWCSEWRRRVRYAILERRLPALRKVPVLLIAGERDTYVHPTVTRSLVESIDTPLASIWEVPDAKHNQARDTMGAAYDRRLVEFFSSMCPQPVDSESALVPAEL